MVYIRSEAVIQTDTCDSQCKVNKKKRVALQLEFTQMSKSLTKESLGKFLDKPSADFHCEISHVAPTSDTEYSCIWDSASHFDFNFLITSCSKKLLQ